MNFDNVTALVTGSGRGIGKAIAKTLYDHNATVIISDLRKEDIDATVKEIAKADSNRISGIPCDVSNPDAVDTLFDEIKSRYDHLDCLVNNAGITRDNLFLRMKKEEWQSVIDVNLTGTFLCCRSGAGLIRKSTRGRIVNISSVAAQGNPGQANYAASKAGIIGLTRTLALELARYNVTVNAVAPGFIDTEMTRLIPEKAKEGWLQKIPLARPGTVDDVANSILFLLSEEAGYITGQLLGVDGGLSV